jgi:hypothetical protein
VIRNPATSRYGAPTFAAGNNKLEVRAEVDVAVTDGASIV